MFKYVKLKNFKSLGELNFNLCDTSGKPKHLLMIYGGNGIGKSNLLSAFFFLHESFATMNTRDMLDMLLARLSNVQENNILLDSLKEQMKDTTRLIKGYKMIDSTENVRVEYGFEIDGKDGCYVIELNDEEVVYERLEYTLVKKRGIIFEINKEKTFLSNKIFFGKQSTQDLFNQIERYWGKHSFMAIFGHELKDKAMGYYTESISSNFFLAYDFLDRVSCKINYGASEQEYLALNYPRVIDSAIDRISIEDKDILLKTEKFLNHVFKSIYSDIDKVYFKTKEDDKSISYKLIFRKYIDGKYRDVNYDMESTGVTSIVKILPYIFAAYLGYTVVVDEFDTSLHENLTENIVASAKKYIEGQLIFTTHNLNIMNMDVDYGSIYHLTKEDTGKKAINCILDFNNKLGKFNNVKNQYLDGKLGKLDEVRAIDFSILKELVDE